MEDCLSSSKKSQKIVGFEGPYRLLYCSGKGDKAGPNLADYNKRTALHLASCEGADVNSTDRSGRTPLSDARGLSQEAICKILEAKGGIDPLPCYEVNHTEVNMDEAALIGEGSYVEIYLVRWRGTEVAAKTIRSSITSNPKVKNIFMKELALWVKIHDFLLSKVTDFGLSKIAQENDVSGYKMTGQTNRYMAPEVYRRESHGMSIDIFSFALIVHDMFLGGPPNQSEDPEKIADKLLKACWHQNPDCRPTFQEIILQLEEIQAAFQDKMKMGNCSGASNKPSGWCSRLSR
ncbi:unnamed protein product [Malus baccata var. baccata]